MHTFRIPRFTAEASLTTRRGALVYPAMRDDGGIDCSNCLGGECVELRCFENWTQGGGGPGGPYEGGGGGGGWGGGGGGGGSLRGCRDRNGSMRRHGSTRTTTEVNPPGGPDNTWVSREQCRNGRWVDLPF